MRAPRCRTCLFCRPIRFEVVIYSCSGETVVAYLPINSIHMSIQLAEDVQSSGRTMSSVCRGP